jgi:hypothetical protein
MGGVSLTLGDSDSESMCSCSCFRSAPMRGSSIGYVLASSSGGCKINVSFPDSRLVEVAGATSLAFDVKEFGKEIKAKFHDTPTGFFILRSEDMH